MRTGYARSLIDKSYPGDNRVVAPESPYRRRGSLPQHTSGSSESNFGVLFDLNHQFQIRKIQLITVKPLSPKGNTVGSRPGFYRD